VLESRKTSRETVEGGSLFVQGSKEAAHGLFKFKKGARALHARRKMRQVIEKKKNRRLKGSTIVRASCAAKERGDRPLLIRKEKHYRGGGGGVGGSIYCLRDEGGEKPEECPTRSGMLRGRGFSRVTEKVKKNL